MVLLPSLCSLVSSVSVSWPTVLMSRWGVVQRGHCGPWGKMQETGVSHWLTLLCNIWHPEAVIAMKGDNGHRKGQDVKKKSLPRIFEWVLVTSFSSSFASSFRLTQHTLRPRMSAGKADLPLCP